VKPIGGAEEVEEQLPDYEYVQQGISHHNWQTLWTLRHNPEEQRVLNDLNMDRLLQEEIPMKHEVKGLEAWKRDHRPPFILYILVAVLGALLGYSIWSGIL